MSQSVQASTIHSMSNMPPNADERQRLAVIAFEHSADGILVADREGLILSVNPAFCRICAYAEEELLGRNMALLRSMRQDEAFYAGALQTLEDRGGWQGRLWVRRKAGEDCLEWLSIRRISSAAEAAVAGQAHYLFVLSDIARLRQAQEPEHLAQHDILTGLPNRVLLRSRLHHSLQRSERLEGRGAVLFLDLDDFSTVNESLGQQAGDELLNLVALRLNERLRSMDTLARLGGDKFIAVLEEINTAESAALLARIIVERIAEPFELEDGRTVSLGTSIGIALFPKDGHKPEQLIERAAAALDQAKQQGRGVWCFYAPEAA